MFKNGTVWLFVAGAALALAGCGGEHHPSSFGLTWQLALVGSNQTISCDAAGTDTVTVDSMSSSGQPFHDQFPCSAMSGVTQQVPPGSYHVVVSLQNLAKQAVSGIEGDFVASNGGITELDAVTFQIQSFFAAWTISRGGAGVSCRDAGAATVRLITRIGNDPPVNYDLPCIDPSTGSTMGSTTAIPIGTYSIEVQLLDSGGHVLSDVPAMTFTVDAQHPADLPPITFSLT